MPDGDLLVVDETEDEELTTKADADAATEPVGEAPAAAPATEPSRPARPRGLLGEVLVKRALVTDAQVARRSSSRRVREAAREALVDMGALDERVSSRRWRTSSACL